MKPTYLQPSPAQEATQFQTHTGANDSLFNT